MQNDMLKEATEELKEMYGENICRSTNADDDNAPSALYFVPLTKRGESIGERRDMTKEMRRTQEKFLKQCKSGSRQFGTTFGAGESTI